MAWRVELADQAALDLQGVRYWYRRPGAGHVAVKRLDRIVSAIERLAVFPRFGAASMHEGFREFSVEGHRIVYRLASAAEPAMDEVEGVVQVVRIIGPGQDRSSL